MTGPEGTPGLATAPPCPPLEALREGGVLGAVDVHLARRLGALAGETDPWVLVGAALASRAPGWGHVCMDLARPVLDATGAADAATGRWRWPAAAAWAARLARSPLVACPPPRAGERDPTERPPEDDPRPLTLHAGRLYLTRCWRDQAALHDELTRRAAAPPPAIDVARAGAGLARLFPGARAAPGADAGPDWQRVAVALALARGLAVISGGPGTGKTTTVVKLLALLQGDALARGGPALRVALVAPTGKAAARLAASIEGQRAGLDVAPAVRAAIPAEARTIHRLLGAGPAGGGRARHDARDPVPIDVLVCDEASMVDLPLMARLLAAVPRRARVVLLGDRHQLASVEAGSVLGDLCDPAALAAGWGAEAARAVGALTGDALPVADPAPPPLRDAIVELRRSYRFDAAGGIGGLARAIQAGDAEAAVALLARGEAGLTWLRPPAVAGPPGLAALLAPRLRAGFAPLARARDPGAAVGALGRFGVLCAVRGGPRGVEAVNALARAALAADGLAPARGAWWAGRPVLVARNDPQAGLSNGDVGVALPTSGPAAGGASAWRVHFPALDGRGTRALPPARLPEHETVYAMTIHKSQGSELDEAVVVLPDAGSPVLTRELLYTAVTRARAAVTLVGDEDVLRAAIARPVQRASGLRELLWGR